MAKQVKQPEKEYTVLWLGDDGAQVKLGQVITSNPEEVLFNDICRMMVIAPYYFSLENMEENNIRKLIRKAPFGKRDHYFAKINGQILSIMEVPIHPYSKFANLKK